MRRSCIKDLGDETEYDEALLHKIVDLIDKYDARQHVCFLTGNDGVLKTLALIAPDIALDWGIDVILTNDYQKVSNYCRAKLQERQEKK